MSIEAEVKEYSDETFSAEGAARYFFTSYNEAEIDRKQKEMTEVQRKIEIVLKRKVRDHYRIFLFVNERINEVGNEVADVKRLIQHTQKLFNEIQSADKEEVTRTLKPIEKENKLIASKKDDMVRIAGWLLKAPQDLSKYIVEQQYSHAVGIVIKTRDYIAKTVHLSEEENAQALEILKEINQKSVLLANTIKKSLLNLPNSPLWGANEQNRRLQLLIKLGKFDMAADGFSQSQVLAIKKVLRASVESTAGGGDVLALISEFSKAFFGALLEATRCFRELFAEHYDHPSNASLLLNWAQVQITSFLEILSRHLHLGTNEYAALVILQLREIPTRWASAGRPARRYSNFGNSLPVGLMQGASEEFGRQSSASSIVTRQPFTFAQENPLFGEHRSLTPPPAGDREGTGRKDKVEIGRGAFWFLSRSLHIVFGDAKKIVLSACCDMVSWILLPELDKLVHLYAEEFIKEIQNQVSQDGWNLVSPSVTCITLSTPVRFEWASSRSVSAAPVASSYDWLVSALNHFIDSSPVASNVSTEAPLPATASKATPVNPFASTINSNNSNRSTTRSGNPQPTPVINTTRSDINNSSNDYSPVEELSYSRSEVCEVESSALSSILRILLRYVMEVKSTDVKGFTKSQLTAYINTLQAISSRLIPSLQAFIESFLLLSVEPSTVSTAKETSSYRTPESVFAAIQVIISLLIQERSGQ